MWRFLRYMGPLRRLLDRVLPVKVEALTVPAVLLDARGGVVAANGPGAVLEGAFGGALPPDLRTARDRAVSGREGTQATIEVSETGKPRRFEASFVPIGDRFVLVTARDTLLDHNLREALVESRQRYKDLVEVSADFAWEIGANGAFTFVSPSGALGWAADDLVGARPEDFARETADGAGEEAGPADRADRKHTGGAHGLTSSAFHARRARQGAEVWFRRADGSFACLSASVRPIFDAMGSWVGARGVCHDVTDARERDAALARAHARERLFGYITRTIRDAVEPDAMLDAAVQAIARALTADGSEIHRIRDGAPWMAASCGAACPALSANLVSLAIGRAGVTVVSNSEGHGLAVATRFGGTINGILFLWRRLDVGAWSEDERELVQAVAEHIGIAIEQVARHEQLHKLSRTDGLTGLLNRRSFLDDVARRHERASRGGSAGALVYCDLDNFKQVNDTHGHERGDDAIRELARLLTGSTRGADLVARLGGDEFALWLDDTTAASAEAKARDLLARCDCLVPYSGGSDHPLGMSIGIAVDEPGSGESLEELMARADAAMYVSKNGGKGRYTIAPPPRPDGEPARAKAAGGGA